VLSGLTKRIDKEIAATSLSTPEDIEGFFKTALVSPSDLNKKIASQAPSS
jgi:hypothetical protein